MQALTMHAGELIDPEREIHYAFHRSLKNITIRHRHDFYELFIITKGSVVHKINGRSEVLNEGTLVFIRPADEHYYEKNGDVACEIINLAFPQKAMEEMFRYLGTGFDPDRLLAEGYPPYVVLAGTEKNLLVKKLEQLSTLHRLKKDEIRTRLRILLLELFTQYFPVKEDQKKNVLPGWLSMVCAGMQKKENFSAGLPVLLEMSNRTPGHLCRVFKKHLGITPTEYINELRLNYAANMLTNSDESIINISAEAGFDNLSHFYHLFKKKYGLSPKHFRTRHRKSMIPARG